MSLSEQYDIGSRIKVKTALENYATTNDSDGAALTTQDGITIDRQESGLGHYYSCKAAVSGAFTAASSQRTVTATLEFQHSSDGTSWEDFSTATAGSVTWGSTSTGGSTGTTAGTDYAAVEQKVNLRTARRYIRVSLPPVAFADCSSGYELNVHGVVVFGGADELPAS